MALGYLLEPFIQINTIVGTPVVGAKIYVYKGNTTVLATTYRDFEGHLNTNPVRTNTLGNCTIIAEDSISYDIEIRDALGLLLMSKKNVTIGNTASGSGELVVEAGYGIEVTRTQGSWKVAVDTDLIATQDDLADKQDKLQAGANIEITDDNTINVVNRRELVTEYPIKLERGNNRVKVYLDDDYGNQFKPKQDEVNFGGGANEYISYISQDENGEIDATVKTLSLPAQKGIAEGTGIDITTGQTEDTISVDTSVVALKSDIPTFTEGTGIDITTAGNNKTISIDNTVALKSDLDKLSTYSTRVQPGNTTVLNIYGFGAGSEPPEYRDVWSISVQKESGNSKAYVYVYNRNSDSRALYVYVNGTLTSTVLPNTSNIIKTIDSAVEIFDIQIRCLGVGPALPFYKWTMVIDSNALFAQCTLYERVIYEKYNNVEI